LPAAEVFSTKSTESGKKSMPSRGFAVFTVVSTTLPPIVTTAAPADCFASRPVSMVISVPPTVTATVSALNHSLGMEIHVSTERRVSARSSAPFEAAGTWHPGDGMRDQGSTQTRCADL